MTYVLKKLDRFDWFGLIGILLLLLALYCLKLAPDESTLKELKWKVVLLWFMVFWVHYSYLGVDALKRKRYFSAVALFIFPFPMYWIYFLYHLALQFFNERPPETSV